MSISHLVLNVVDVTAGGGEHNIAGGSQAVAGRGGERFCVLLIQYSLWILFPARLFYSSWAIIVLARKVVEGQA